MGEYTVRIIAPNGYALEGSGRQTWEGTFIVGRDTDVQVGAYVQVSADNPSAQPQPGRPGDQPPAGILPPDQVVIQPEPAARLGKAILANSGEMTWQDFPPSPTPTPAAKLGAIRALDAPDIRPPRAKILNLDSNIKLVFDPSFSFTQEQEDKVVKSVLKELTEQYKGIEAKQRAFKQKLPGSAAPNHEDLLNLALAVPRGIIKSGVQGVEGRLDGDLAQWIFQEGFGVDPAKAQVGATFSPKFNKNWNGVEVTTGLEFKFREDRVPFSPAVTLDNNGKFQGATIGLVVKW